MDAQLQADVSDLSDLTARLGLYKQLSGKATPEILTQETKEWCWGFYNAFKARRVLPETIVNSARSRGFRVARQNKFVGHIRDGLSARAMNAAEAKLGGQASDLFQVTEDANGIRVRRAMFSGRTKQQLKGGRYGNRFAKSALKASQLEAEQLAAARKANPNLKRLNKRALATAIELGLRSSAAKGGTMAVQWLPKVFKNRRSSTVIKDRTLITRSSTGLPMGQVNLQMAGDNVSATIESFVPGTAKQLSKGIFDQVKQARIADRDVYITRKLSEMANKAFNRR